MKPALLVIDVQNEYFAPHGRWVLPDGEAALERVQRLLEAARAGGHPVFHVRHESLDPGAPVFRPGSRGVEPHPAIEVRPGELRIQKHYPGSFTQTPLEAYLGRAGADTVVICGYMTHMCCDTTTRQARERGFGVWFASDATATRDLTLNGETVSHREIHRATLAVMAQFATVAPAEDIVAKVLKQ